MMKKEIILLTTGAILTEGIITYINTLTDPILFSWKIMLSICIGILIAITYDLNLPKNLGLETKFPIVGNVLTGLILSRGSNYIFDLMSSVAN